MDALPARSGPSGQPSHPGRVIFGRTVISQRLVRMGVASLCTVTGPRGQGGEGAYFWPARSERSFNSLMPWRLGLVEGETRLPPPRGRCRNTKTVKRLQGA